MSNYIIKQSNWESDKQLLSDIRREVFIKEQHVPEELEWDEFDEIAQHVLAFNSESQAVGTGRIKKDGHVGRMAVLKKYRHQGVGSAILLALVDVAKKQKLEKLYLHAQVDAIPFYIGHGFVCEGDEFLDAGIPHKTMCKNLS